MIRYSVILDRILLILFLFLFPYCLGCVQLLPYVLICTRVSYMVTCHCPLKILLIKLSESFARLQSSIHHHTKQMVLLVLCNFIKICFFIHLHKLLKHCRFFIKFVHFILSLNTTALSHRKPT